MLILLIITAAANALLWGGLLFVWILGQLGNGLDMEPEDVDRAARAAFWVD